MGMVHHIRKQEGRLNTVVYGCVSDGNDFDWALIRLDDEWREVNGSWFDAMGLNRRGTNHYGLEATDKNADMLGYLGIH
jgi:hypothetical protein